jgi:hypothetical protein
MGLHEKTGDAGCDRGTREHWHEFALATGAAALAPGSCTECVASNTTGQPVSRITASERMSDTRLL